MPRNQHPDVHSAILQTALHLVNHKGINHISLREIARELKLSPSSLYEYFTSKEAIIDELRNIGWKLFDSYFVAPDSQPDPKERLYAICLAYLDFAHENPEMFNMLFLVLSSKRKGLSEPVPSGSPYRKLLDALEMGVQSGLFDRRAGSDSEVAAYSLWAMVHGMATLQNMHLVSFEADWQKAARTAIGIFMDGLATN